jgi:hypothetical protein
MPREPSDQGLPGNRNRLHFYEGFMSQADFGDRPGS